MKKIIMVITLCFFLVGCGSSESKSYSRDTNPGSREFITLAQMKDKFKKKETFAITLAQSRCTSCAEFNTLLKEYILDHHVVMYEVILDFEATSTEENKEIISKYLDGFENTPGIYFVEDGKQKSMLKPEGSTLSEEEFEAWVVANQIDKKE